MDIERMTPALAWALDQCWAITPEALEVGLKVAARQGEGREAIEAREGRPLDNTRAVTYRDSPRGKIATVPISGPIFAKANLFTRLSGGTSSDILARDFQAAVDDPTVAAIVLDVDSPGGQVTGTAELARLIRAARDSKPVVAHASGDCCSAAYWLASAAQVVVAGPTSSLGSIGVVTKARKREPPDKSPYVELVSSNAENKRLDPASDAGKRAILAELDAIEDVFHADVAAHRGVTPERVRTGFGRGGTMVGRHAVEAGLADRVGTLEEVIATLGRGELPESTRQAPSPRPEPVREDTMDWRANVMKALFGGGEPQAEGDAASQIEAAASRIGNARLGNAGLDVSGMTDAELRQIAGGARAGAPDPEKEELRRQLAEAKKQATAGQLKAISDGAIAFAGRLVKEGRVPSKLRGDAALLHAQAALVDAGLPPRANLIYTTKDGETMPVMLGMDDVLSDRPREQLSASCLAKSVETLLGSIPTSGMTDGVLPDGWQAASNGHDRREDGAVEWDDARLEKAASSFYGGARRNGAK